MSARRLTAEGDVAVDVPAAEASGKHDDGRVWRVAGGGGGRGGCQAYVRALARLCTRGRLPVCRRLPDSNNAD